MLDVQTGPLSRLPRGEFAEGGDLHPLLVEILDRIDIAVGEGFLCIREDVEDLFPDEEDDFEIDGKLSIISYALTEQYGYQVTISDDFCTLTIGWFQ